MNRPELLSKESYQRSQWKNGLGHTDQIAIEPPDAKLQLGNYLWRMSSASIATASDFSIFPDHDRALMILSGAGIRLTHKDEESGFTDTVELPPFEPYEFPGDIRSRCDLLDGPVRDLSIFFRKGEVSASLEVVRFDEDTVWEWNARANTNLLFAVRGGFEVALSDEETQTLPEGDTLRLDHPDHGSGGETESVTYPVVPHSADSVIVAISLWTSP
jgi:environmental stress-induced protein Ves